MTEQQVTSALRALRESAGVGVREMARRLGISPNSYTHYENPARFKDSFLPMAWAIKFADALEPDGVDRAQVLALAGGDQVIETGAVDARIAQLSPRRRELLMQLLQDLEAAEAADPTRRGTVSGDAG